MTSVVAVACPDEDDVVAFVEGSLGGPRHREVEHHIDGCGACAEVVASLVRIYDADSLPADVGDFPTLEATETERSGGDVEVDEGPVLRAGAHVGRYGVLECIGFGGMGVVYSAYDPELDRRVALKVLRGAGGGDDELRRNARLLREAQAMAKLSHPNVITVHDVGNFEGKVFLAMEFVDGTTLGRWMRAKPRAWKEIRTVFLAAGHGLAAAHNAGLVHRDFKPDNVLIGDDGRVRVTDFGLARFRDETIEQSYTEARAREELISGQMPAVGTLTKTGVLVGTPAYMAPEQYEGRTVTSATDQFSFCVALFEALWGERPFAGRTLAELAANVCAGRVRQLRDPGIPVGIRDAVRRGLSFNTTDRYPTMQALLVALQYRPSRVARRWAIVAVPTALLALNYWWGAPGASAGGAFCRSEFDSSAFWVPSDRARIAAAFGATSAKRAAETAAQTVESLDAFARRWSAARKEVCDASGGETLPGTQVLKSHCLLRYRARFEGLVEAFAEADARIVSRALPALEDLPDPGSCIDDGALDAGLVPLPPSEINADVSRLREELERSVAGQAAFRTAEAREAATRVLAEAEKLGYAPLIVEARVRVGQLQLRAGEWVAGRDTLEAVAWQAVAAHHRRVAASAWIELVFVESAQLEDFAAAHRAERAANAELAALGHAPRLEVRLLSHSGALAVTERRFDEAMKMFEAALALEPKEAVLRRGDLLFNIAAIKTQLGKHEEAADDYRAYIRVNEEQFGEETAAVGAGYYNLGATLFRTGRYEEAREQLEHALRIEALTLDEDHPVRADTFGAYATVLGFLDETDAAEVNFRRAIDIASQPRRGVPTSAAFHRLNLAKHLVTHGDADEAQTLLEECKADLERLAELGSYEQARWASAMCDLAKRREDYGVAKQHCEVYLAAADAVAPPDREMVASATLALAEVVGRLGDNAESVRLAESVLATPSLDPALIGRAYFSLARELWRQGEEAASLAQARLALTQLDRLRDARDKEGVELWMSEHPRTDAP